MKKVILILIIILVSVSVSYAQVGGGGNLDKPVDVGGGGNQAPREPQKPNQKTNNQKLETLQNPLEVKSIEKLILLVVDIMIYIGISFAILAIIWVGFQFVMAQGNETKITNAKEYFMYIIIGLAVLISARVIVELVRNTLVKSGVVNEKLL